MQLTDTRSLPARLHREELATAADPLAVCRWLRHDARPVALSGAWAGGGLVLSSDPLLAAAEDADPFAVLDAAPVALGTTPGDRAGAVGGGWIGWLGFGLCERIERLPPAPPRPVPLPRFDLAFHDHVVRLDADGRWWFEALWTDERAERLDERLRCWRARLAAPAPPAERFAAGPLAVIGAGATGHRVAVAETVARIHAGELSQANICLRLEGPFTGDALELWLRATVAIRPAYAAFIGGAERAIASLSPELFLRRRNDRVTTRPIKGTAPRDRDPADLAASAKDRAENVMIVDLMRNDLGRVSAFGSVAVDGLCAVEPAAGVWHLVSTVSARLRSGAGDGDLLRATFPPGSVTGAPKVKALETIRELEGTEREAYCGAVGLCSPLAGLELNVAIRTLEIGAGRIWLGAGGGIVADSDPEREVEEAMRKAQGICEAAGIAITTSPAACRPPVTINRLPRPDPALGVIETMLVRDGTPARLGDHLARLGQSLHALGIRVPDELEREIVRAGAALGDGALRARVDGAGLDVTTRPLPSAGPVTLEPVILPGGLGAHKWADRKLIEALSGAGRTPLICDLDETVLEAGYAAVLLVLGDELIAPVEDGRLLPSLSRAKVMRAAPAAGLTTFTRPFTLADARAADAIILASSLRGPHPGILAGGPAAEAAAPICAALSTGR
jgi:para-aminobenzoate synthetase/4-amino-4-deoxychorismate lyase